MQDILGDLDFCRVHIDDVFIISNGSYEDHLAKLTIVLVPTLTEQLQHNEEAKAIKQAKDNSNNESNRRRTTYFCIGCSNIWSKPVHSIIKSIKDKFNLQWLRVLEVQLAQLVFHKGQVCTCEQVEV